MDPITLKLQAEPLILQALREDMNAGDLSTEAVMPEPHSAVVDLIAKQDGVIAGLDVFARTFELLDPNARTEHLPRGTRAEAEGTSAGPTGEKSGSDGARAAAGSPAPSGAPVVCDGDEVRAGDLLARVYADARALLSGERVALNFLQRMSGIATYTRRVANLLADTRTRLVDTRKTTPCLRVFEKEAVRLGGAGNHRYNLSQAVMLKDNHIAAAGGIVEAVRAARERAPFVCTVEVEVENLTQVREALIAGADIIMLDNMTHDEMATALEMIGGAAKTECSGNVTAENVRALADLGVDYISSGALTHSAGILDLSMKYLRLL